MLFVGVHAEGGRYVRVKKFASPLSATSGCVDARKRLRGLCEGVGLEAGATQGDDACGALDLESRRLVERFYTDRTGWSSHLNAARICFPMLQFLNPRCGFFSSIVP